MTVKVTTKTKTTETSSPMVVSLRTQALGAGLALAVTSALASGNHAGVLEPTGGDLVAIRAGTIHVVEAGGVVENGTMLVRDGKIEAVGSDVAVPLGARVVNYGPDAVIAPGFVAANSNIGVGAASQRTADPQVQAIDNVDFFSSAYLSDVAAGVTTAYVPPARGRLIAGQGAVVKLHGDDAAARTLSSSATIHGAISTEARSTPGYWEPPVPATVDVGLGVEQAQLPRSTMGAILALREVLDAARGKGDTGEYGPTTPGLLKELMDEGRPWRIDAKSAAEIRSLQRFMASEGLPLVIEGGRDAGAIADEIAKSGASVVLEVDVAPNRAGRNLGRGADSVWPSYDTAVALAAANVPFALATSDGVRARDLRFSAGLAMRGGLDADRALHAITLGAAEILGVQSRVGSLVAGKDADFVVLTGAPMASTTSVVATWIDGHEAWSANASTSSSVVIEADEVYLGDGRVLRPGQVLVVDGKIAEVGHRVGHPVGASVVRGAAAMPGIVDALGHLGLEGSTRSPSTDYAMSKILDVGDATDQRVAQAGVTTVVMTPRGANRSGSPMMAYKPAASDLDSMVVAEPTALRFSWTERSRFDNGKSLTGILEKATEYKTKWDEYEAAVAAWTPPATEAVVRSRPVEEEDEEEDEEDDDDKKDDDEDEDEDADVLSGVWTGTLGDSELRLVVMSNDDGVEAHLRSASAGDSLVELSGAFDEDTLSLRGIGGGGWMSVSAELKKGKLTGTATHAAGELELAAERTSEEVPRASRPKLRKQTTPKKETVKGEPKSPGRDAKLEPFLAAMRGEGAIVVDVAREDDILACVDAFEAAGIKPVLYGASEAWRVADQIQGRVAGIILSHQVLGTQGGNGLQHQRNRYAQLAGVGIPLAFHSAAEEGAAELPVHAAYAVANGMSPDGALRALTGDAAKMMGISGRVGVLEAGCDGDVLLLDGPPLELSTSVLRTWVNGEEIR